MKEFLSKHGVHVVVAVSAIVALLWFTGSLKSCDELSVGDASNVSSPAVPASSTAKTAASTVNKTPTTSSAVTAPTSTEENYSKSYKSIAPTSNFEGAEGTNSIDNSTVDE